MKNRLFNVQMLTQKPRFWKNGASEKKQTNTVCKPDSVYHLHGISIIDLGMMLPSYSSNLPVQTQKSERATLLFFNKPEPIWFCNP